MATLGVQLALTTVLTLLGALGLSLLLVAASLAERAAAERRRLRLLPVWAEASGGRRLGGAARAGLPDTTSPRAPPVRRSHGGRRQRRPVHPAVADEGPSAR